jgi:hypothetical protein
LALTPFWYVSLLFLVLQYNRQIQLERKLFHTRLHSLGGETLRAVLWGLLAGAAASLVMLPLGVQLTNGTVVLVLWGLALILMLIRVRFLCLAYAVGALGILQALLSLFPDAASWPGVGPVAGAVAKAEMPGLLALVGVLHIAEGLLVAGQAARMASPMFYAGKRGKIVGGYSLQGFWPIPLFLLAPLAGGSEGALPWTPLFAGGDAWNAGWTLIGLPIMLGYSELSVAQLPQRKARASARWLLGYGALMVALAVASHYWLPLAAIASVLSIALHEALIWRSRREEERQSPLFVHDTRGLRILAVIPGGPAAEIGLQAGEIIAKVNAMPVRTKSDLHEAIRLNPAFCKLEVLNLEGEIKFAQRPIYAGDHHALGIILAPDQEATHYVEFRQPSFAAFVRGLLHGGSRREPGEEV